MAKSSKVSMKFVVILGIGLFLAGYIVGSFIPATSFGNESFLGANMGGRNNRRN